MFPPFVNSFGDQFTAVLINLVGTVSAGLFVSIFNAVIGTVVTPLLESFATGAGIPS